MIQWVSLRAMRKCWWLLGFGTSRILAATVSLPSIADTSLYENKPDSNLGGTTLVAGTNQKSSKSRALILFDTSALPAGAVVTAVQVELYVTRQPDPDQHGGPVASDFSLHRMLVNWGEGHGSSVTGSVAMNGDATWNERFAGQDETWGNPGGAAGTDFADLPSATTSVGDVGPYVWGSSPELIDDVRAWMADPASNFGFMLVNGSEGNDGSARRFSSRDQPGGSIPGPKLIVTYDLVPEAGTALLAVGGACLLLMVRRR